MPDETITTKPIKQKTIALSRIEALKGIVYLKWGITSPTELSLLNELITMTEATINIDHHVRNRITKQTSIPLANISTAIGRLHKAGAVVKEGKTVYLHPVFKGWNEVNQVMFKINE